MQTTAAELHTAKIKFVRINFKDYAVQAVSG